MSAKQRKWDNWATTSELAQIWNVSQRRVQQILQKLAGVEVLEVGVLVIDIGSINPVSKPIYRRID